MLKIDPKDIDKNFIDIIGNGWMLVTAGKPGDFNTMTASWGAVGELWNRPVAFVFVRPQRYTYQFAERENTMTLSFFSEKYRGALQICGSKSGRDGDKVAMAGLTPVTTENGMVAFREASLVLECRKLYVHDLNPREFVDKQLIYDHYMATDYHRQYVMEIIAAWQSE